MNWGTKNHNNIHLIISASFVTANIFQAGRNLPQGTQRFTKNTKKKKEFL